MTVGDWNGDGVLDIAAAREDGVTIYLANGGRTFIKAAKDPFSPGTMAMADFNGDGRMDLAIPGNGVTVLLGDAAPTESTLSTTSPLYDPERAAAPGQTGDHTHRGGFQ